MIRFDASVCRELDASSSREWLETNTRGGFASSTICGANTRRYHGLLVAATKPPVERKVLLSKIEEVVAFEGGSASLACNFFLDTVSPRGFEQLEEFRLDPWPVWRWRVGRFSIEKSVCLLREEDTVLVEYRLLGAEDLQVSLELKPLIAFRDYHATTHANGALRSGFQEHANSVTIRPYPDLPELHFIHSGAHVEKTGDWYLRFQYPRERERGLDSEEDLFQPFSLTFALTVDVPVRLIVSTVSSGPRDFAVLRERERVGRAPSSELLLPALDRAASQFIAARGEHKTVMAGYHWFTDWGRDTMISLPGLAIETGHAELAKDAFLAFLPWMRQGLLPNRFPDAGEQPEYNSTDATLWFVEAVRAYVAATGDFAFVEEHGLKALREIVEWRERGTLFNIHCDEDGLLTGGEEGVQLTWMDARVNGRVITPRTGKPVEIQALWYNALRITAGFAGRAGDRIFEQHCDAMADAAKASFAASFWNDRADCLFDVVNGAERNASIRPNQIFALSLAYPLIEEERAARVLKVVKRHLLTPFGLRTLSPDDPQYRGTYQGGLVSRDEAYHQGTVWPWLLGPYVRALLATRGRNAETMAEIQGMLEPFEKQLLEGGLGQIGEVFDGDEPHRAGGCIAQAWSVGELLRVAKEAAAN